LNKGTIIILNGTSSAGKTSLVHELQSIMPEPFLEAGIDIFLCMLPRRYFHQPLWDEILGRANQSGKMGHELVAGMYQTALTLSNMGMNVLMDHVLVEPEWIRECAALFHDSPAYLIGVRCPIEVVEQREECRRERTPGQARKQIDVIHANLVYDFELDTSLHSVESGAQAIKDFLDTGIPPRALKKLFVS
jgi:chloramphenicol 3-O phosphotransferase